MDLGSAGGLDADGSQTLALVLERALGAEISTVLCVLECISVENFDFYLPLSWYGLHILRS